MQTVSFRVPDNFKSMLEVLSDAEDRSVSDFIKHAVKSYIIESKNLKDYIPTQSELKLLQKAEKTIRSDKLSDYDQKDFE